MARMFCTQGVYVTRSFFETGFEHIVVEGVFDSAWLKPPIKTNWCFIALEIAALETAIV